MNYFTGLSDAIACRRSFGVQIAAALLVSTGAIASEISPHPAIGDTQTPAVLAQSVDIDSIESRGAPPDRQSAGTRSDLLSAGMPMTALLPETETSTTVSASPVFFFYVPQADEYTAEFILRGSDDQEVYATTLALPAAEGIVSLSLPSDVTLEVNQRYEWIFAIMVDPYDRSGDLYVRGWIERIEPDPAVVQAIAAASLSDRPRLYAEVGVWHEMLTSLAELRRADPDNPMLTQQWDDILQSVGLGFLHEKPLLSDLNVERSTAEARSVPASDALDQVAPDNGIPNSGATAF